MRVSLFTIDLPGPGRLSTMARPRGHDWLPGETAALAAAGADVLVCALTPDELDELGLTAEPALATAAGLEFVSLPIRDRTVPDPAAVLPTLRRLTARLRDGAHVVTHCRAGIGRSSLLAVSLLVLGGTPPETAWAAVRRARGLTVPDTPEQRAWPADLLLPLLD
ncbi:tyrosine protein phosphatase [Kitasatospora sp. DSM 101779]|uniref:phosphatase domain-containing protein n=1 Tax=Kitasatospora sp. DSM 101779 TaxID=2853165 RepID=UPI0021D7E07C|nr:tyrosine protein phosphatase [Kitasatospora sp. DSM 101779]MCU7820946.1 tyrosine protein phosphatase [Kitasatospora sp. DSM 101779]